MEVLKDRIKNVKVLNILDQVVGLSVDHELHCWGGETGGREPPRPSRGYWTQNENTSWAQVFISSDCRLKIKAWSCLRLLGCVDAVMIPMYVCCLCRKRAVKLHSGVQDFVRSSRLPFLINKLLFIWLVNGLVCSLILVPAFLILVSLLKLLSVQTTVPDLLNSYFWFWIFFLFKCPDITTLGLGFIVKGFQGLVAHVYI